MGWKEVLDTSPEVLLKAGVPAKDAAGVLQDLRKALGNAIADHVEV